MSCGVFPSTEKGGLKFMLLFDLSVLFDYFVYRQVIHMFFVPRFSDRWYFKSSTDLHSSCS